MISSRKKDVEPSWHPDFRNKDTLPDIKVIRTGFVVNFFAIAIPLLLAGYLGNIEYQRMALNTQHEALEGRIENLEPKNAAVLKKNAEFNKLSKQLGEIDSFAGNFIAPVDLILAIAQSRPEGVLMDAINIGVEQEVSGRGNKKRTVTRQTISFNGTVEGTNNDPLLTLQAYEETLLGLDVYQTELIENSFTIQSNRESATKYTFTVSMQLDPNKKEEGK